MFRKTNLCAIALMAIAAVAFGQDVDEIIAKNTEAKGGREKMESIQSMTMTGKMTLGPGMDAPFTIRMERPDKVRIDFTFQGMTGTQAYDGATGWSLMPFMGKTDPEEMPEDQLRNIKQQADFDGPLFDYEEKGHEVELLGEEEFEGTPVFKLRLKLADGDESTVYIDQDSYLELQQTGKREMQGQEVEYTTTLGDYKDVDGLIIPHSIESGGMGMQQVITIESIEFNPEIDDEIFEMPEVTAAAGTEASN